MDSDIAEIVRSGSQALHFKKEIQEVYQLQVRSIAITALGVAVAVVTIFGLFTARGVLTSAASNDQITMTASAAQAGDVATVLNAARNARYQASYTVQFATPLPPAEGVDPASTPPNLVNVGGAMDWAIATPQRRFDARVTSAPPELAPGPGAMPTFFFDGTTVVMCEQVSGGTQCYEVPYDWAQFAMPFIGQSPILFFPFIGDTNDEQLAAAAADAQISGSRDILGETATCLTFASLGLEACYTPSGVPVQVVATGGGFNMDATSYTSQVDQALFAPPAQPAPLPEGAPPPGSIPLPPGVDPEQMARCLAETGDAGACLQQLAPAPEGP
jgi:hypothetical protein